jgi:predicted NUDIX family NTP pyrophosphohydrolase
VTDSAGLLPYRRNDAGLEVLIAHPGGPLWARKDAGAWSVVKGEIGPGEDPMEAARREFTEETGWGVPTASLIDLGSVRQRSGKRVHAWALPADFDPGSLRPGAFVMEWPPRSNRRAEFLEIDRVAWFGIDEAGRRLNPAQAAFLARLEQALSPPLTT